MLRVGGSVKTMSRFCGHVLWEGPMTFSFSRWTDMSSPASRGAESIQDDLFKARPWTVYF